MIFLYTLTNPQGICPCGIRQVSLAAVCTGTLYKRIAVRALGHCGVGFMGAYSDAVQRAVAVGDHIVLALGYGTLDVRIFFHFVHTKIPSF